MFLHLCCILVEHQQDCIHHLLALDMVIKAIPYHQEMEVKSFPCCEQNHNQIHIDMIIGLDQLNVITLDLHRYPLTQTELQELKNDSSQDYDWYFHQIQQ